MPVSTVPYAGLTSPLGGSVIVSGTAVSASSTSVDFTGIPSWVKRVTVMFNGVSTNGTSQMQIQVGSGSVSNTGYISVGGYTYSGPGSVSTGSTTGFILSGSGDATLIFSGAVILSLLNSNTWVSNGVLVHNGATPIVCASGGNGPALGGALDRVRITTVGGSNTFDAGTINILYE